MKIDKNNSKSSSKRPGCLPLIGFTAFIVIVMVLLGAWWVKYNIYASEYTPVKLSESEQKILDKKLDMIHQSAEKERALSKREIPSYQIPLEPEPYTEEGAQREINLTEKELNAMIANTPEVARRAAIDLSEDLVSVKLVLPVDEEVIILGGKTLRINLGLVLAYKNERPVIALKGISLGGIPMPNAWLGYMKNKNLVEEFGTDGGFWQLFAEGVRDIKVREGHIRIRLKE